MSQPVTITQVANGFIVELPYSGYDPDQEYIKSMGKMVAAGLKELKKDDILDSMQEEAEENQPEEKKVQSNIYIYKTWEEVAEFLEYHFK